MQACGRIFASPYVEGAGLDGPYLCLRTPELQLVFAERELEGLRLAGLKRDALESLELADRARCRAPALVNIDLRDGIAWDASRCWSRRPDLGGVACLDARLAEPQVIELEASCS